MLIPYLSIATSLVAAGLGIRAATIPIRDSTDDMMLDIGRQGKWASGSCCRWRVSRVASIRSALAVTHGLPWETTERKEEGQQEAGGKEQSRWQLNSLAGPR